MARWCLAVAVLLTLCPSSAGPAAIARAQDHTVDDDVADRVADDAPVPLHTAPAGIGRSVFAPPPGINAGQTAPHASRPPEHVAQQADDAEAAPEQPADAPPPPGAAADAPPAGSRVAPRPAAAPDRDDESDDSAPPARGNRRIARTDAADACPADLSASKAASFKRDDRLVMTYYYYWYDQDSLADPAMAQHPPNDPPLDWRSVTWHERQLMDMATAGIDVALAVYWGDTSAWSVEALKPMVEARENLLAAGFRPPAIGLFFDTNLYATILPERPELADLTTADGQDMLAHQVGVFFDHVPPCHRARVDGRPLAFFWRADTEDGDRFTFDDRTFSGLNDLVMADHGERLHLVLEYTWKTNARKAGIELGAADIFRWGAALDGPRFEGRTVAIGPGYDDRTIAGRPGYTRERVDGITYSRDLRLAVMSGAPWLLLETWNELWEGTAIAETEETGRTYLGITARYTALFHQLGSEQARDAWFDLGSGHNAYLRRLADQPVEQGMPAEERGRSGARPLREDEDGTGYFHFAIDRRLHLTQAQPLTVLVEYFDEGEGSFTVEYDSLDHEALEEGAYTGADTVHFENTRTWRQHRFDLPDASLLARQYGGGGDFRIHDRPGPDDRLHAFGRVMVTAAPASRPVPFEPESLSFVDPSPRRTVSLRWSEADATPGYLVVVQPLSAADDVEVHGFTIDDRRRCVGESEVERGPEIHGLARKASCDLRMAADLDEGIYRWRVQGLDANGNLLGEVSDWAFFVVARR
jgi:hypothetical protein